ncbi:MAG: HDOD domain-containing protein [Fimbriimonadaceae bacterium]
MNWDSLSVLIGRGDNLPMLSQVASSLMRLADDPDSSHRTMAKFIEQDPAISAKILRVANSAAYGGQDISSVNTALSMLGMKTIRSLAVSIAYQQVVSGKQSCPSFSKLEFWRHSLAVGVAARILGKMKDPAAADQLYFIGLFHDVGMLVLERFLPQQFDTAIRLAQAGNLPLHQAEQHAMGFSHAEAGALLAEKWGLPQAMWSPIRYHHEPMMDMENYTTTSFIAAADLLANQSGFTNNDPKGLAHDDSVLAPMELPEEQVEIIRSVIGSEVDKAQQAFQIR